MKESFTESFPSTPPKRYGVFSGRRFSEKWGENIFRDYQETFPLEYKGAEKGKLFQGKLFQGKLFQGKLFPGYKRTKPKVKKVFF